MGSVNYQQQIQEEQAWVNLETDFSKACYMHKFKLFETCSNFYMIGWDKSRTFWKVLKIDRSETSELIVIEDSATYSEIECYDILQRIHNGNICSGGLKFVTICYGIVGFIKFLGPYYMLLITKRRKIGMICGHTVYSITKNEMIPISSSSVQCIKDYSKNENRSFVNSVYKCKMYLVLMRQDLLELKRLYGLCTLLRIALQCSCFQLIFVVFLRTSLSFGVLPILYTVEVTSFLFIDVPFSVMSAMWAKHFHIRKVDFLGVYEVKKKMHYTSIWIYLY